MVLVKPPYYMTNEEWYHFDEKQKKYVLTKKAPAEAVKNYNERQEYFERQRQERKKYLEKQLDKLLGTE